MSWSSNPLRNKIIVALIKRKGEIIDDDLARLVYRGNESAIKTDELQRELMNLEIQGVVSISQITKTRKRVRLINTDRLNQDLFKE